MRVPKSNNRGGHSSSRGWCSSVMCLSWILISVWILFLVYCWQVGLLDQGKINQFEEKVIEYESKAGKAIIEAEVAIREKLEKIKTGNYQGSSHVSSAIEEANEEGDIHVIFSTDCSPYQDWQTLVMFYSALIVGQKGKITRIASGCDDTKKAHLIELYSKLYHHRFGVHFTPDFKKDAKTGKGYDFYNKPYGLQHWLANAEPPIPDGMVICLLDPDMVFVRPITTQIKGNNNNLHSKQITDEDLFDTIGPGRPVAQTYGLGAPWTNDNHKKFNRGRICGEGSPCLIPNDRFGSEHYSVGPPYIVEKSDMIRLAETWTTFVPRVYEGYPYLLAEMYAYSMAAAHEKLPHLQLWNYMVSNVDSGDEGWSWVDKLDSVCVPPDENGVYYPGLPVPNVIHYCQTYRAGDLSFQKRRVPHDLFTCEHAMLMDAPRDLGISEYRIKDGEVSGMDRKQLQNKRSAKRNAYTLCILYDAVNQAMKHYKDAMCGGNEQTSYEKTINLSNL